MWNRFHGYHVNDYLCSVRVVTDAAGDVLERNDYSGFGKRLESSTGILNRYRFSGKEEQTLTVPGWQDFGARMYDPDLARWTTPDPLADQYPGISPYAYCAGDPVNFVDPEGESWGKVLKAGKKIYKTAKAGKKIDVKDLLEGEVLDIVDNANTLLDTDASAFEKGIAAFDLVTGFGDEAKWLAKTVGVSDAIVDRTKTVDPVKNRVKPRKSTRESILEQAPKNTEGDFIDPNTGAIIPKEGPFDIGHKQGQSWKRRKQEHINKGSTRKEVIEAENDPKLYQVEDPKSNRSRRYD